MARKHKKCPYFTSRKDGRWTKLICTLPPDKVCPNPHCQANPEYQEPDLDDEE